MAPFGYRRSRHFHQRSTPRRSSLVAPSPIQAQEAVHLLVQYVNYRALDSDLRNLRGKSDRRRLGNKSPIFRAKDYRHKSHRAALSIVNLECDELAFPIYSFAKVRLLMTSKSAIVSLSADQKNKVGPV